MKKVIFFLVFCVSVLNVNAQEKIYTLTEVDVAPTLLNYQLLDSLDTKQNFRRNLKKFVYEHIGVLTYNKKKIKIYAEFLIDEKGKVRVLRLKGKSGSGIKIVKKVISKLKITIPALKNGHKVIMKYIIPITFNPVINIGTIRENTW